MEHNPVYWAFFKYHKFTQIMPTTPSNFAQFLTILKSPKFLKLDFDVFVDFLAENIIEKKTILSMRDNFFFS